MSTSFLRAEELLSPEQLKTLSAFAQRLYAGCWNRLRDRNLVSIWIRDEEICMRARIPPEALPKIQNELDQSGLIRVTPGLVQSRYEFVEETQD